MSGVRVRVAAMVAGVVALLVVSSCTHRAPQPDVVQPSPDTVVVTVEAARTVTYHVDGSVSGVSFTAQTPTGSEHGEADVSLSTRAGAGGLRFTGFRPGDLLYISAQNAGEPGALTCQIQVDGVVVSSNSAAGAFSIATCQATMP